MGKRAFIILLAKTANFSSLEFGSGTRSGPKRPDPDSDPDSTKNKSGSDEKDLDPTKMGRIRPDPLRSYVYSLIRMFIMEIPKPLINCFCKVLFNLHSLPKKLLGSDIGNFLLSLVGSEAVGRCFEPERMGRGTNHWGGGWFGEWLWGMVGVGMGGGTQDLGSASLVGLRTWRIRLLPQVGIPSAMHYISDIA
jgi:hypothetical protein